MSEVCLSQDNAFDAMYDSEASAGADAASSVLTAPDLQEASSSTLATLSRTLHLAQQKAVAARKAAVQAETTRASAELSKGAAQDAAQEAAQQSAEQVKDSGSAQKKQRACAVTTPALEHMAAAAVKDFGMGSIQLSPLNEAAKSLSLNNSTTTMQLIAVATCVELPMPLPAAASFMCTQVQAHGGQFCNFLRWLRAQHLCGVVWLPARGAADGHGAAKQGKRKSGRNSDNAEERIAALLEPLSNVSAMVSVLDAASMSDSSSTLSKRISCGEDDFIDALKATVQVCTELYVGANWRATSAPVMSLKRQFADCTTEDAKVSKLFFSVSAKLLPCVR